MSSPHSACMHAFHQKLSVPAGEQETVSAPNPGARLGLESTCILSVFIFSDKPQPPAGPIKIVESSANITTIQWKPPKDDGGKPVQRYIVERQQVGKNDWVTLGETPRTCTTFTTNKVEQDTSYYFRVRAVNAEGTSDALESDEVKAVSKGKEELFITVFDNHLGNSLSKLTSKKTHCVLDVATDLNLNHGCEVFT